MSKMMPGNAGLMRDINRTNVMELIRTQSPVSQADMAKIMNLQPSTVLRIIKELETEGFIYQSGIGPVSPKGGRKAGLWTLNAEGAFAIGVDLGAEEIITLLVGLTGNIVDRVCVPSPSGESSETVMEAVIGSIEQVLDKHRDIADRIIGIGVGLPGRFDRNNGISQYAMNFPNWRDVPVVRIIEERFGLPTELEGDMKLMALGEKWFSEGGGAKNILCIGYRRGIGLGIVINGQIVHGRNDISGDLGHIVVNPDGKQCHCGRRGCLEAVASESAILEWLTEYIKRNGVAVFDGIINSADEVSMHNVYLALKENNRLVVDRVKESGKFLGRVLSDLVRIFDPETIIFGGKILEATPVMLQTIKETYESEQPDYSNEFPEILPSRLADNSIALGSAILILSQLFQVAER